MSRQAHVHRRGFTLVEMMIAVLLGSFSVLLAAEVAQVIIRQRVKAREVTDLSTRARLVSRQIRADLRVAGYGSTGAIAVDNANWPGYFVFTPNGAFPAIPAVMGANAAGPGASDAIQIVVPDLGTVARTLQQIQPGAGVLFAGPLNLPAPLTCPSGIGYVVDHTAPTGQGRAQLFRINPATGACLDNILFGIAAGSEVMCARLSTYYIHQPGGADSYLRRSDYYPGLAPTAIGPLRVRLVSATGDDIVAPGILNMQVAYRVSAEAYNFPAPGAVAFNNTTTGWAYAGGADFGGSLTVASVNSAMTPRWFEVRVARVSLLARTLQRLDRSPAANENLQGVEDLAGPVAFRRDLSATWVTAAEPLINLKYFDLGSPAGVPAEPY